MKATLESRAGGDGRRRHARSHHGLRTDAQAAAVPPTVKGAAMPRSHPAHTAHPYAHARNLAGVRSPRRPLLPA